MMVKWNVGKLTPGMFLASWHAIIMMQEGIVTLDKQLNWREARNLKSKWNLFRAVMRANPSHPTSLEHSRKDFRIRTTTHWTVRTGNIEDDRIRAKYTIEVEVRGNVLRERNAIFANVLKS